MSQGDKRLVQNIRERIVSADLNDLQTIAAAEKAELLRSLYDDRVADWYLAPGLQVPIASSSPSLAFDVYGGLMVKPDSAGYFLVQGGTAGFLLPTGLGTYDSPYRVVVDPGVVTPGALPFTSNAGGGAPRWDVVECQPVDTTLAQESRYIFNPGTGIASPEIVDKIRAMRLTYRVRIGTPGGGFPGLAAGWAPLAVVCAPAGSSSLLTSDVWDVRPLVRERVRRSFPVDQVTGEGYAPNTVADYRMQTATINRWAGASEAEFNGYVAGGQLLRSTPCQLSQFGDTAPTGGRYAAFNIDLSDNQSNYVPGANAPFYLVALFPYLLPRWQRYSQTAVGSGRVPTGPRGILVATNTVPKTNGIVTGVAMPAAAQFGGGSAFAGAVLSASQFNGTALQPGSAAGRVHEWTYGYPKNHSAIVADIFQFDFNVNDGLHFPPHARRVRFAFRGLSNNSTGTAVGPTSISVRVIDTLTGVQVATPVRGLPVYLANGNPEFVQFDFWCPILPKDLPSSRESTAGMRVEVSYVTTPGHTSATLTTAAWSASD